MADVTLSCGFGCSSVDGCQGQCEATDAPTTTDPTLLLMNAIEADARHAGCPVTVVHSTSTRWSSATFAGARHDLSVEAADTPELDAWLTSLPQAELPVRVAVVADLVVKGVVRKDGVATVAIEALTVAL